MKKLVWLILAFAVIPIKVTSLLAEEKTSTNRMFWSGYAHTWYEITEENNGKNTFRVAAFPIFHYKVGDKIHFTSEMELEMDGEGVSVGVETAEANIFLSNNVTLTAGRFFTPVGVFVERLHPAWINKLHSQPLHASHGNSMIPFTQVGAKLKGVLPISGYSKIVADFYVSNGVSFSTITASSDAGGGHAHGGTGLSSDFEDSNRNKSVGGRIGLIPFKGGEVGFSLLTGKASQKIGDEVFSDEPDYAIWGIDSEYHGEVWEVRGEYINSRKDKIHEADEGEEVERKDGYYIQAATRLSIIPAGFYVGALTPWEIVFRYSATREEESNGHKETTSRTSLGINYYITPSASVRISYDWNKEPHDSKVDNDTATIMLAVGF